MAFGTGVAEVTVSIPPNRLWMALVKDSINFLPKALPDVYTGASYIEGDGGAGSIIKFNLTPFNKEFAIYEKLKVAEINDEDFLYKYTAMEIKLLSEKVKAAKFEMKLSPMDEEVCLFKLTCQYEIFSDSALSDVEIQQTKAGIVAAVKMVESYLLSNPEMYR